jgi:hypothetical protein
MIMRRRVIIGSILLLTLGFMSCQKNDRSESPSLATTLSTSVAEIIGTQITSVTSANEYSISVEKFDGHSPAYVIGNFNIGNYGIPGLGIAGMGHLKFGIPHIDSCATVTVSSTDYPKEIVIEYAGDCIGHRNNTKKGKITINISDTITNEGAVETITYTDFYIDSIKIELEASIKNLGKNSSGNWMIEKEYKQTITKNNDVCTRVNKETVEWIAGFETTGKSDNVYYLTGTGKVVFNDTTYVKTITTPLLFDGSCEYVKSGVVEITKNGSTAIIDYGDGTCDNKATVTIDGTTEEISLHSHRFGVGGKFGKQFRGFGRKGVGEGQH